MVLGVYEYTFFNHWFCVDTNATLSKFNNTMLHFTMVWAIIIGSLSSNLLECGYQVYILDNNHHLLWRIREHDYIVRQI